MHCAVTMTLSNNNNIYLPKAGHQKEQVLVPIHTSTKIVDSHQLNDTYRPLWTMKVATTWLAMTGLARMFPNSSVSFSGSTILTCSQQIPQSYI